MHVVPLLCLPELLLSVSSRDVLNLSVAVAHGKIGPTGDARGFRWFPSLN